jgi:hypothetical protein
MFTSNYKKSYSPVDFQSYYYDVNHYLPNIKVYTTIYLSKMCLIKGILQKKEYQYTYISLSPN